MIDKTFRAAVPRALPVFVHPKMVSTEFVLQALHFELAAELTQFVENGQKKFKALFWSSTG